MSWERLLKWLFCFNCPLYYYYDQLKEYEKIFLEDETIDMIADIGMEELPSRSRRPNPWFRLFVEYFTLLKFRKVKHQKKRILQPFNDSILEFSSPLIFSWLYFFAYTIKYSLNYIPRVFQDRSIRIWLGSEFLLDLRGLIETILLIWCVIAVHFLICCRIKNRLNDYSFLRIFLIDEQNCENFGLTIRHYRIWKRLCTYLRSIYYSSLISLTLIGSVTVVFMYSSSGLFQSQYIFLSMVHIFIFGFFIFITSAFTYSNFIVFVLSAEYVSLKLNRILVLSAVKLNLCSMRMPFLFSVHLRRHFWRFMRLKVIVDEYNHFWSPHLTCVITLYILQLAFLVFSIFFEHNFNPLLRMTFIILLSANLTLLFAIVEFASRISRKMHSHTGRLHSNVSRFLTKTEWNSPRIGCRNRLMVFLDLESICDIDFGFSLQTGGIITNQTFQFILLNTAMYFLLFMKQRRGID